MAGMDQSFVGQVKSFNHAKGWGFIECAQTHAIYGTDVFLLRGQIQNNTDIGKGDQVSFTVVEGEKGAQAANVQVMQSASSPDGAPTSVQGPYNGTIKNFSADKGYGFIACDQTHQMFGKDIFVMKSELPPGAFVQDGTALQFFVRMGEKGPQATRVQLEGQQGGGWGGGGYGKGGMGGGPGMANMPWGGDKSGYGKGGPPPGYGKGPGGPGGPGCYGKGGPGDKGCYGKDGWGGGWGPGYDGYGGGCGWGDGSSSSGWGPGYGGGYGDGSWGPDMGKGWGPPMGGDKGGWGCGPPPAMGKGGCWGGPPPGPGGCTGAKMPSENQVYFGTVKHINTEKGWGHISCEAVQKLIGKDVFVMKSNMDSCPDIAVGLNVMFNVSNGPKGPHGINVRPAPQASQTFVGTIRSFNSTKGWGFIDCPESAQIFEGDVFVHSKAMDGATPSEGEQVSFTVDTSSGRPAAANVVLASAAGGQGVSTPQGGYGPANGTAKGKGEQYSPY